MEKDIIIWLQGIGNDFWDVIFKFFSHISSWIGAILFFAIIILLDKKFGIFWGLSYLFTVLLNFIIKNIVRRPRPYVSFAEIQNKMQAGGYSFPSGHTVSAVFMVLTLIMFSLYLNKSGKLNIWNRTWFRIMIIVSCILFVILVAISRMYLGQHYPSDIFAGAILSLCCFIFSYKNFKQKP